MDRYLRFLLLTFSLRLCAPTQLPAQPLQRSATTDVLQSLGLSSRTALAARLQIDNDRIRSHCLTPDGAGFRLSAEGGADDDRTLYFSLLYLSHYGRGDAGLPNVKAWLARQGPDGFIPASPTAGERPVSPFLAQIALLGSKQATQFTWLLEAPAGREGSYYQRLQRYLDYWSTARDGDGNGLPAWKRGSLFAPSPGETPVESVELACYLHREYQAMALLAHQLRRPEDIVRYRRQAKNLADSTNAYLWEENDGFYYDRDEGTGKRSAVRSATGFLPLFAGIAPYARAERLVREHLRPDGEFRTAWPLPVRPDSREPVIWIPINYMVVQGLLDYGYRDLAESLAARTFALVFRVNSETHAYYDDAGGQGRGPVPTGAWSALAYLLPWECELNYTPSTLSWQPLVGLGPAYLGVD